MARRLRFIMTLRGCCALLAVLALPFLLEATTGCSFSSPLASNVEHNAYVCACSCGPGLRHRSLRVGVAATGEIHPEDDVEQRLDTSILVDSPDLDFLNGRFVGLRFRDVQIPKDAHIFAATVQFTAAPGSTTGLLTVQIAGEAVDDAAPFSTTPGSLGALYDTASTTAKINWNPADWVTGAAGGDQLTPDLHVVLQEIVSRPMWAKGNALVLLFKGTAGAALRKAYSQEGKADAAALLTVEYEEPAPPIVGPQELPVCLAPGGGTTEDELAADCEGRVQQTLSGLAEACSYPSDCICGKQPNATSFAQSLLWADKCEQPCVEEKVDVEMDCANFDPVHGLATATNAEGDQPVCAAYSPLAAEVFGRRTMCAVAGTAPVTVDDDAENPHAQGIVQFVGVPCPEPPCAVGMQYKLDIDPVTFGNFFHSETFRDLGGVGETNAGAEAMLSPGVDGSFARDAAGVSARGRRGSQLKGLVTANDDPVAVKLGWGQSVPICSVKGTLIGTVDPELKRCAEGPDAGEICEDDSQCAQDEDACSDGVCNCEAVADADLSLGLDVSGTVLNQPPTADAGPDQAVECATAAVTNVVLDASASTDVDANIALYSWLRGSRGGAMVGFDELSRVEQSLGTQTYVLRVIDGFAQADEDTTVVDVMDTMPPVLSCSVATPVLNQTNHDLVNVGLAASAVDQCEGELPVSVNVFADEDDDDNTGDGRFSPDAAGIAVGSLRLRAERQGNSDGRVYLIIVEATDSSGNRGSNCCTVVVPNSRTQLALQSAQAQAAAARAFCLANAGTAPAGYFTVGDGPVMGPKQ